MKANKGRRPHLIGTLKSEVRTMQVPNPLYSRAHAGTSGNPQVIDVAVNVRESPIAFMASRGHLEEHQIKAAVNFRRLWETCGGAGAGAFDYSREPVDGGGVRESITDRQIDAGLILKRCREYIGVRPYSIVEKVAGQGLAISDLAKSHRERTTMADYLKDALDDLAEHWGLKTRGHRRRSA